MVPSIVQRNDIDPLQTEVKEAVIKTGNGNEELAPKLVGASCVECSRKVRRGARRLVCFSCRCHFHFNCVTSTRLQADILHRLVNWQCRFRNSRPDLVPNHPVAEPRLHKQYQGPRQDHLSHHTVECQRDTT